MGTSLVSGTFVEGFLSSLFASAAWALFFDVIRRVSQIGYISYLITFRLSPLNKYISIVLLSTVLGAALGIYFSIVWFWMFVVLGIVIYPTRWLYLSTAIGLFRIDRTVRGGTNYTHSLKLAKNSLEFLGTGASKLTDSPEFVPAVQRCNREGRPIRFILSDPANPALARAAAQAGVAPDTYGHRVRESLKKLAALHLDRHMNIEVRLYTESNDEDSPENFRIMLVDDNLCLVSYNIYGRGDGSDLPQLVFKNSHDADNTKLFFTCFQQFFQKRWRTAKSWNPQDYRNS